MSLDVTFAKYDYQDRSGYVIISVSENASVATMVSVDQEGKLHAAKGIYRGGPTSEIDWHPIESRENATWAYSMLTGTPSEALLDVLGIPHVDRERTAGPLFKTAAEKSEQFLPTINREALKSMEASPEKRLATYDFFAVDGDRGLYRKQAAQSFPVFADLFNSSLSTKMAIDRKKPLGEILIPLLSELAGAPISNGFIKRFQQAPAMPEGMRLTPILQFAAHVQPDWFPKTPEDWTAFYTIAHVMIDELNIPRSSIQALIAGSGGKWHQLAERAVAKAYPDDEHDARRDPVANLRQIAVNARDTLESFTDMVVLPLVAHAQEADDVYLNVNIRKGASLWAWDMLFEGRNLPDLCDISRRFHQERAAIMEHSVDYRLAHAKSQIKDGGWPGLTVPVQAPNGLWLIPLQTPEELREEGRRLSHCVGGYHTSAAQLNCHIVSVREGNTPDAKSLSTCEFTGIKQEIPALNIRQHTTNHNRIPTGPSHDAIDWYIRTVQSGRLKTNWSLMQAFLNNTLVDVDHVEKGCGYDWRDRTALNMAVRPWGHLVTKVYRTKGLDDMMDSAQAQAIISGMTPAFLVPEGKETDQEPAQLALPAGP